MAGKRRKPCSSANRCYCLTGPIKGMATKLQKMIFPLFGSFELLRQLIRRYSRNISFSHLGTQPKSDHKLGILGFSINLLSMFSELCTPF